jgi:hypothetical protein
VTAVAARNHDPVIRTHEDRDQIKARAESHFSRLYMDHGGRPGKGKGLHCPFHKTGRYRPASAAAEEKAAAMVAWRDDMLVALREARDWRLGAHHSAIERILTHWLHHPTGRRPRLADLVFQAKKPCLPT